MSPTLQILYYLSYQGSPRILEWVAYSFSIRSFQPRNQTGVSCIAGGFFTIWATREALESSKEKGHIFHRELAFPTVYLKAHFSSVLFSGSVVSNSLQHARPPCPSPTSGVHQNPCPSSRWCHPTVSSSVIPYSSCPQSFPASGSFQRSQLFASGGQSIGVSTSILPVNTQDWSPLGWTGWIFLQSKGLSRVFNITVQKHQFFCAQLSLYSNSHIHMWPLKKP